MKLIFQNVSWNNSEKHFVKKKTIIEEENRRKIDESHLKLYFPSDISLRYDAQLERARTSLIVEYKFIYLMKNPPKKCERC